jgi:hypothetical protein
VLGTPPALILSQDQTLKFNLLERALITCSSLIALLLLSCVGPYYYEPADTRRAGCSIPLRSCELGFLDLCCTLYLVFKEPRTVFRFPKTGHPITWIHRPPFLGEPFKLTTTVPCLSTLFSLLAKIFWETVFAFRHIGDAAWRLGQRNALDREHRVNRVFQM